jgi:NAD+ kinase
MIRPKPVRTLGVMAKPKQLAGSLLRKLISSTRKHGPALVFEEETARWAKLKGGRTFARSAFPKNLDMLLVLGGDGTLLSAARAAVGHRCPILGVNAGGMGFLTSVRRQEMLPALDALRSGKYLVKPRGMLTVRILRKRKVVGTHHALNDVVVHKRAIARLLSVDLHVGSRFLATCSADGVVVSTPTGSTAYSLAAGGPIIYPHMNAFVITPIAPHSLTFRSIIISDILPINITPSPRAPDVFLTLDGQTAVPMERGDSVRVQRSRHKTYLVRLEEQDYFSVLRQKLHWGKR